jgi:hypothetical protein
MRDELQKHTLNLRAGDYERIQEAFSHNNISAAVVIRRVVSKFVDSLTIQNTDAELLAIKGATE